MVNAFVTIVHMSLIVSILYVILGVPAKCSFLNQALYYIFLVNSFSNVVPMTLMELAKFLFFRLH